MRMNRLLVLIVYTYTCLSFCFCVVVESFLFKTSLRAVDIEKYPVLLFVSSEVSSESNFDDIYIESINKDDDNNISDKIFRKKVCLIDDNAKYHNECQELSLSLDLPMLTELPNSEQDDNPFDHILKLVPYESDMISTFALAIQALPQRRQQQENTPSSSRRKKPKRKKQQPVTLPFYVDLCPSKQSKIGKRTNNNGSQQQQKSGGGSDLLLKATGIIKKKQQGKQGQSSVVDDRGDDNDDEVIVYDLTAGFGQDSLVMAMTGRFYHVIMFERDPVVAALLHDALRRIDLLASLPDDSDDGEVIKVARMLSKCLSLVIGDSTEFFNDNNNIDDDGPLLTRGDGKPIQLQSPDVVYLDPMFPSRTKSAAVKKNMQILHGLLDTQKQKQVVTKTKDDDSTEERQQQHNTQLEEIRLLNTALQIAKSRVVVKRPIKASSLGCGDSSSLSSLSPPTPSYSVKGSTSRWDVYLK